MSSSTLQIPTARKFVPLLNASRYKGAHGGRGSGKSQFFAGNAIELAIERSVAGQEGLRMVCIREIQKSLDQSVKQLLEKTIEKYGVNRSFDVQKFEIKAPNDGLIIFQGMQNHTAESIKSLEGFDIAWVEEAQSLSETSLKMLRPTIRKPGSELWFSWNPRKPTDPVDKLFRSGEQPPRSIVVEANWRDNPWFPEELREEKDYDLRRDPDKYAHVWGGGYETKSEARVFRNWKVEEVNVPSHARHYYGADWGFSNDPTVLVSLWIWDRMLYIDREAYGIGIEIDQTPEMFAKIMEERRHPITADNARPETISYMNRHGFKVEPSVKGKGSVEDGVKFIQSHDVIIHPRCKHSVDEFTFYSFKVDRHTQEILTDLEDANNHVIDATRYALESARTSFDPNKWVRAYQS